ncbi:cytochrome P450 / NADPH-cytochrome P450 reductase [Thalassobacillus cyri]|uniref:Bifunctional cytochrome P450/NADPH--P450 reductase n=1 Tax=Thalassobacillus cyri TaxID=571932 RepID=A0A1H3XU53_9BACI|nr:bifunctional cytochrome P450/NADPH--P450 reductase [Thalassobacillus cyri]SEA02134.1 cytochrome P450 / NADPH-cytochrome P450 reductase [Thalassobacillus cyri]
MKTTHKLPQPKSYGPLGNLPLINKERPIQSFMKLAEELGPIYQFQFPGRLSTFVSSAKLAAEICDEDRFDKKVGPPLQKVRPFGGDGLFTSETSEPNWKKAHNILLPSFSQQAMKGYHDKMVDLATQLVQKWARLNPNEEIEVPEDITRLTLDTIGLCGFNYRFNSFYREKPHPFVDKMVHALDEAMNQTQRLGIQEKFMVRSHRQFKEDIDYMFNLVDQLIAERKQSGDQGEDDLLAHMLTGKDPETGEALDDENIRFQIITFLIAGHETTSGLLSFALYYLMKNPDKLRKAYEEVDEVLGDETPTYKQVKQLKYVRMILNESLRLWPTAPAFSVFAKEDTTLAGKYDVEKGDTLTLLLPQLHRDTTAWGNDVEEFKPERFQDPKSIPHHAYKPFGNGQRACIGQQFALHEAILVLGMILQHFELEDHSDYQLDVKETLTLKPEGLKMRVKTRKNVSLIPSHSPSNKKREAETEAYTMGVVNAHQTPLLVLYGSNLGTAEGVAQDLATTARQQGFNTVVAPLDEYTDKLPTEGAMIIVTASYNGKAPDNAAAFVKWIQTTAPGQIKGVRYAVFGCGDRNWADTYQRIPTLIDQELQAKGATRIVARGDGDASDDFDGDLEKWEEKLWPNLASNFNLELKNDENQASGIAMDFVSGITHTPLARNYYAFTAVVAENRELQKSGNRSTRHIELTLPKGVTYKEGDHLGVLPQNSDALVQRVLNHFKLEGEEYIVLSKDPGKASHLPTDQPVRLKDLLASYVELQEPATRAQIRELAAYNSCPPHKADLEQLLEEETYKQEILQKRVSMFELLEHYISSELPFERFLALLPGLKPRYYSISSSPIVNQRKVSITVGVVRGPAWSGNGEYKGVASNYLALQQETNKLACFIRAPQSNFQLPENPETPMVLVGPGTGVAPFRGFIQARKSQKAQGHSLGETHLYFGCRHPEEDFLYEEELKKAEHEGIVQLHTAFSRQDPTCKTYVQHLVRQDAATLLPLLENGAHLYICGDGNKMAPEVTETLIKCYQDAHRTSYEDAASWLQLLEEDGGFAKDIWAGA